MKREFHAHPLMLIGLIKPFWFILIFPLLKGALQYIISRRISGVLTLELIAFMAVTLIAGLRCRAFKLTCGETEICIKTGFFLKTEAVIPIDKLSSMQTVRTPFDAIFRSVTYKVNTEAGNVRKSDFEFKLSLKDSIKVSELLYGKQSYTTVKFSAVRVAIMAATTSSAVTGMIIGVPIINKAGKLLGIALNDLLLDEINSVSGKFNSFFPPIINTVTLIILSCYAFDFIYSFLKYINFKLFFGQDKLEVHSGFFIHRRTSFRKASVNNVKIDQTPLMRLFRRYVMMVSVGGYGNSKSETAVIAPSGRRGEIKRQFSVYFPFLKPDGNTLRASRDRQTERRFLYLPFLYLLIAFSLSAVLICLFRQFARLILFLSLILCCIILYYRQLCLFEFRYGKLKMGNNIYAKAVKGFNTCELYCPKENVGEIKLIRNIPDIPLKTCKTVITVRSESADRIKIRHLNYTDVKRSISDCYGIDV